MAILGLMPACSVGVANDLVGDEPGDASSVSDPGGPDSIRFEPNEALLLPPRTEQELTVSVSPPGRYTVRFAILPSDTDTRPNDASLDRSEITSNDRGKARVTLLSPSGPATFALRASVGTNTAASITISVSDQGYTDLRVVPDYSGKRQVSEWVASARAGASCADLSNTTSTDGQFIGKDEDAPTVRVPVGPTLAVTLRAGHYISGCADVQGLTASEENEVIVRATDRPMRLSEAELDLKLGVTEQTGAWTERLQNYSQETVQALFPESDSDTLLFFMGQQLQDPDDLAEFEANRIRFELDALLSSELFTGSGPQMRETVANWLDQAAGAFAGPDTFRARLVGKADGYAWVELTGVAANDPEIVGFAPSILANFTADSGDIVLLGMTLRWVPSRLLTGLANEPAQSQYPESTDPVDALSMLVDCTRVAELLVAQTEALALYAACSVDCAKAMCEDALVDLWGAARNYTTQHEELTISATAEAELSEDATPVGFDGTWVGTLPEAEMSAIRGEIAASAADD